MLTLHTKLAAGDGRPVIAQLVLPYDQREKCRLRATLSTGEEAGALRGRAYLAALRFPPG